MLQSLWASGRPGDRFDLKFAAGLFAELGDRTVEVTEGVAFDHAVPVGGWGLLGFLVVEGEVAEGAAWCAELGDFDARGAG